MKVRLENISCKLIIGGKDFLVDPNLLENLRTYLSVGIPGAYYTPAYEARVWDGRRRFITPKGRMATGFLPLLLKYIEEEYPDLDVEILDERGDIPVFRKEFIKQIGSTEITEEYEHQKRMIQAFDSRIAYRDMQYPFPRGIMNAATNAGKTAAMAGVHLNLVGDPSMLVLIHRKPIFEQLVEFFKDVYGEVGIINAKKYDVQRITVGMIKTVYNRLAKSINVKKDLAKFDVIAVDECHMAGSKIYSKVLQNVPAPVRVFVSGTPFDSDAILNKMIAIGLSGPEVVKVTKRELMDKGISQNVKVHMHLCYPYSRRGPTPTKESNFSLVYSDYIQHYIHTSVNRVSIMWNILAANKIPTLIAVEEIAHGKFILDGFHIHQQLELLDETKNKYDYFTVAFVHGTDPDREDKIKRFNGGELDVLITTRILKEGVNMPIANQLIYALGGKSGVNVKQWMGRIERTDGKASEVLMHDFYDIGQFVEGHSRKRLKVYRKENIEIVKTPSRKEIQEIKRQLLVK